jgi:hypothetical protein
MSNLARIQWDFQEFLLHESGGVQGHIAGAGRASAQARLGLYARAYGARLRYALASNYPAVAKVLGEADFTELAEEYIAAHDSRFSSIRYYGHALAHFVASEPSYKSVPFLPDLAQWEWTMAEVFDAADADPIDPTHSSLRVTFHPSVRVLPLTWNAPQMWQALMDDAERPRARQERQPVTWLLWRHELREKFRPLGEAEQQALAAARAGKSFDDLYLRDWVESGLITTLP